MDIECETPTASSSTNSNGRILIICRGACAAIRKALENADAIDIEQVINSPAFYQNIEDLTKKYARTKKSRFARVLTYSLAAMEGGKTDECCRGPLWYHRDAEFDDFLPLRQSRTVATTITTVEFLEEWSFKEAAIQTLGVPSSTTIDVLGKLLKQRGHTMTLQQMESMAEATARKEEVGMRTDGRNNFCFVENKDGNLFIADVRADSRRWAALTYAFSSTRRWEVENRILFNNLNPLTLGL